MVLLIFGSTDPCSLHAVKELHGTTVTALCFSHAVKKIAWLN